MESDTIAVCRIPGHGADQFVLLAFAVEQGGAEGVEFALFRKPRSGLQPDRIAYEAAVLFPVNHIAQELFERVIGAHDQR